MILLLMKLTAMLGLLMKINLHIVMTLKRHGILMMLTLISLMKTGLPLLLTVMLFLLKNHGMKMLFLQTLISLMKINLLIVMTLLLNLGIPMMLMLLISLMKINLPVPLPLIKMIVNGLLKKKIHPLQLVMKMAGLLKILI